MISHDSRAHLQGKTATTSGLLGGIVRASLDHPYAVVACYLALLFGAWLAISDLIPRRFAPYIESPMVGVVTAMPGLSAQDLELSVSKPVEELLVNVQGLHAIRSTSQDGLSIVTLEFDYGHDMKKAVAEIQALLNVAQANLPSTGANLKPSYVVPVDPLNLPVLSLAVEGDATRGWTLPKVRELVDNTLANRLKTVPNVYSVVSFGGYRRQLQVAVDRHRLAALHLSLPDVRAAIDRFAVHRPAGTLTHGGSEALVRVEQQPTKASDLLDIPLTSRPPASTSPTTGLVAGGSPPMAQAAGSPSQMAQAASSLGGPLGGKRAPRVAYLRDVATVQDTVWERRSGYRCYERGAGGREAIEVSVVQNPGASSATVVPLLKAEIERFEHDFPGIHLRVAYDNAHFVDILFANVWHELGLAIVLTGLALLFFLGEWRGTLIALVTVPTSLALAVLMMLPLHMTFNSGTLIGLLLSIGRLVDDSIIDIHAVESHLRLGKTPRQATIDGIAEVRTAVIASTLMICLALAPLLWAGGIVERMFVELVWPLIFGLLASMLVSFTLTGLLCSRLLRTRHGEAENRYPGAEGLLSREPRPWVDAATVRLTAPFQSFLERLEAAYARLLDWMLQHRFSNLVRIAITVMLGCTFYYFIGSEMMPLADVGQASGLLEMEPGSSYAATEAAVRRFEGILAHYPELEKASLEIGTETMFESWSPYYTGYQMPQVQAATMMLTFCDKQERRRSIFELMDAMVAEARRTIPGIRRLQIKEMGSDVMATAAAPIHINIYGPDLGELDRLGREVLAVGQGLPFLYQPATTWSLGLPEYRVQVDRTRAAQLGLSADAVAEQAYYALRGGLTNEFFQLPNLRQNTIQLRYRSEQRQTLGDLEAVYLTAADGSQVPLKSVACLERRSAPTVIEHDNLRRVLGVTGYYRQRPTWGDSATVRKAQTGTDLPPTSGTSPTSGDAGQGTQDPIYLPSMDVVMEWVARAYGGDPAKGVAAVRFPPGYGLEMRGDMTQMMQSFARLLRGLGLSLALMALVLVVQFRGFLQPLQMVASLPLELAGVFAALWLAGQAFSTVSILGIIVLTGMDITTAVLLLDQIMRYRDAGLPRDEAIRRACPQRLRPILMTSGISLVVMLPVALFPRTGLDAYQPLATAVVGGLTVGTVLSLFDIPIMHTYVDDLLCWLYPRVLGRAYVWTAPGVAGEVAPDDEVGP